MQLKTFSVERYKGYAELAEMELAPLTILVGSNNSGKSALARSIQLLAGGLVPSDTDSSEPLPLESGGIHHGETFEDLLTGRIPHGSLRLSANLADDDGEVSLSTTVQNVIAPSQMSERQIREWRLHCSGDSVVATRKGLHAQSPYSIAVPGKPECSTTLRWQGLIPRPLEALPTFVAARIKGLTAWAGRVRHLQCPRSLRPSPFILADNSFTALGPNGQYAPLALATDDELRRTVRQWYRTAFQVNIDVVAQGRYIDVVVGTPTSYHGKVRIAQSGQGLSQVLPVVVAALTARKTGPGVDVIEHPEAELHPAAHAHVAELVLKNLVGPIRPMVVETHSEIFLLRARRWIAEGRLSADDVRVYWTYTEPDRGSNLRKIRIRASGEMDTWPEGVFIEEYEEVMAIRRAARSEGNVDAHRD